MLWVILSAAEYEKIFYIFGSRKGWGLKMDSQGVGDLAIWVQTLNLANLQSIRIS